jgi:flagellar motor switch protein FliM
VLTPIREAARQARWGGGSAASANTALRRVLAETPIEVMVRTRPTAMRADQLVGLAPGDVVGLDHAVDEPLLVGVEGRPLMTCDVGRQAGSLAIKVRRWI